MLIKYVFTILICKLKIIAKNKIMMYSQNISINGINLKYLSHAKEKIIIIIAYDSLGE